MFNSKKRQLVKINKLFKKSFIVVVILILLAISFFSGAYFSVRSQSVRSVAGKEKIFFGKLTGKYTENEEGKISEDIDFGLYWELWDALKRQYVDENDISDEKMFYGSLKGLAASLGDPYTVFFDPDDSEEFEESLSGTFEGIGAEVGIRDDVLTVISPLDGMPAQKAGLKPGDKIYEIDGETSNKLSIEDAVKKIRGKRGTKVVLTIGRKGVDEYIKIEVERGVIRVPSIKTEMKDGIFVIKLTNFNDNTLGLFNEAVNEILVKKPKGIILDLRNNPGGYLDTAIEIASEWVEDGVIVSEKFGNGKEKKHNARDDARLKNYPTVILANYGSASASEIVTGALKDYKLATIVGEKTFGKGSVQVLEYLDDSSMTKITIAKWFTPNGDSIDKEGIEPDEKIEYTAEDFKADIDPQMDKAIEIIKNNKINKK